jgi:uncharacterized phage protein gp47/JayE
VAPTANDIANNIVTALALSERGLDTSIGTVARKIIDAVATAQAEGATDGHLLNYTYDIDSKAGGALDDFCAIFGIARQQPQRATGVVTFSRPSSVAATTVAYIGVGTQVYAKLSPIVYAQTITSATMAVGQTSVDVPVQATVAGPSGNVAAGTLVNPAVTLDGITAVTNAQPLNYGANGETDDALRNRWKTTNFRNLAGTEAMYRAMALQVQADPTDTTSRAVTQVNILGPKKTYIEQVAVVSGVASTSLTTAAYIYPRSVLVGANISAGTLLTPTTQYSATVNNAVSPATLTITSVSSGMPDGFYDVQFDYVPIYSRNDPLATRWGTVGANINNRVDLWVNGAVSASATQACVFNTTSPLRFVAGTTGAMAASRFVKLNGTNPSVNDIFVPLAFGPILSVPSSMTIGGTAYTRGTHYDIVHQNDAFGYAPNSTFGLVWYASGGIPASNTSFSITYTYNSVPTTIQQSIESAWRLLGTDVWVHAGKVRQYRIHLAVVYSSGANQASVNTAVNSALASYVLGLGFNSALQVSDILQVAHNVPGVDNVRMLTSTDDGTNYAIQLMNADGSAGPCPRPTVVRPTSTSTTPATRCSSLPASWRRRGTTSVWHDRARRPGEHP